MPLHLRFQQHFTPDRDTTLLPFLTTAPDLGQCRDLTVGGSFACSAACLATLAPVQACLVYVCSPLTFIQMPRVTDRQLDADAAVRAQHTMQRQGR